MLAVLLLWSLLVTGTSDPLDPVTGVTGFLTDILCGYMPFGLDGANMREAPWEHSQHCTLLDECKESGYGLLTYNVAGEWTVKYTFDAAGNALAMALLEGTDKYDDLYVAVTGVEGEATKADSSFLSVSGIQFTEGSPAPAPLQTSIETDDNCTLVGIFASLPVFQGQYSISSHLTLQWWVSIIENSIRFRLLETTMAMGVRWRYFVFYSAIFLLRQFKFSYFSLYIYSKAKLRSLTGA
jgi:hypothetical protein